LHREPQASQFPVGVKKKPSAQELHWVLFALVVVVQPGEQVHVAVDPEPEHTPCLQLHSEGAPAGTGGVRQIPVPVIPCSHSLHPDGQGLHCEPQKPGAQFSQLVPVKPAGQMHVPAVEHTAEEAQAGEQVAD
jgi:hypothetical protein